MGGVDPVVDVGGDHPNHNDTISDTPGQALAAAAAATAPAAADAVGTNDGQNGEWSDDRYRADFVDDRDRLPIATFRDDLVAAVRDHQVLIVVGDTGCGKTTQLPQYLHTATPTARIVVTQPRRIAAISAAARVASETGTQLGRLVGYAVRFESARSDDTRILYMTDGALLRTLAGDTVRAAAARRPVSATAATASAAVDTDTDTDVDVLQSLADVVVLDEAHERSLDTDVLFGLLRRACARRPRLRLVIMSATLDSEKFSAYFGDAPVFAVPGRSFPVEVMYARRAKMAALRAQIVPRAVDAVLHIHQQEDPGDVLVFLTGQQDIEAACRQLTEAVSDIKSSSLHAYPAVRHLSVHPIYSALDTADQRAVFTPARPHHRKVVVATNIAQTSVTIPGIRYVVDTGFVKETSFHPKTGVDALLVVPISKAAATQRAGRAGRTAPGKVFRLYSRDAFETLETDTTPEIQRSSLLGTTLALKRIGIDNVLDFEFIDPPERALFATAIKQLYYLGALDENGALTELGERMSLFPTSPFVARAVLAACDAAVVGTNCGEELLTLAAMLSSEDPFVTPRAEVRHAEAVARHARFGIGPDLPSDTEEAEHDSGEGDAIRRRRRRRRRRAPPSGDHVALIRVFDAYVTSGEDPQWCRRNYLRLRSLRAARSIRDQLVELVRGRLGLPLGSCRRSNSGRPGRYHRGGGSSRVDGRQRAARRSSDNGDSRYRGDGDNDDDEVELADYDPAPILRAVCAGFFVNCARRHPARSFYYHYLASSALAAAPAQRRPPTSASGTATEVSPAAVAGSSTSSSSTPDPDAAAAALANPLLSLYIHPSSCLAPSPAVLAPGAAVAAAAAPSHAPSALTDLPNWVVYQDLHFVTRPNMRVVSRIDPAWARTGLDRVAACQLARLLAGCSSAAAADTASATAAAADADADAADAAVSGGAAADGADGGAAAAAASGRGKRPNVDPAAEESGGATRRRIEGGDEASGDAAAEAAAAARAAKADAARARFLARSAATRRGR